MTSMRDVTEQSDREERHHILFLVCGFLLLIAFVHLLTWAPAWQQEAAQCVARHVAQYGQERAQQLFGGDCAGWAYAHYGK